MRLRGSEFYRAYTETLGDVIKACGCFIAIIVFVIYCI
jgi:hypothetical protein